MGWFIGFALLDYLCYSADEWGGPHWMTMAAQWIFWAIMLAAAIAVVHLLIHGIDDAPAAKKQAAGEKEHKKEN